MLAIPELFCSSLAMATSQQEQQGTIDFSLYQYELDTCFHARGDPFPAGTPEHAELLQFVSRLHKMMTAKKSQPAAAPSAQQLAQAQTLGLPTEWNPRYRVNVSVVVDKYRLQQAVRAIDRKIAHQRQPAGGHNRSERRHSSRGSSRAQGGMSMEDKDDDDAITGAKVVEAYRSCLPWWVDFHQRRQLAALKKMHADRAALPMAAYASVIVDAVRQHQAVVIAGDTGCGKSTQVPQFLIAAGFQRVVCTQPRRISAISLCRRVAYETMNVHGDEIAYKIRFASTATGGSRIVFMTEGILLRTMASDPLLSMYDVIIVDEVHERHLNTDFLLALLRALLLQRPELRVVLMSATINHAAYANYFGGAPVIQVPGRLYPIELEYCPPPNKEEQQPAGADPAASGTQHRRKDDAHSGGRMKDRREREGGRSQAGKGKKDSAQDVIDPAPYLRLLQRIDSEYPNSQRGDVLIFVAGLADITTLCDALRGYAADNKRWIVLPLHSSLAVEQQDKVFDAAPEGVRKAIVSTNIAETSVTIDGVRFVVDSGRAKEMVHDLTSGSGSLQEGWISRASADQRKGRAGRTGPGKCFRMYSQQQYDSFRPFSLPEIQRVRLESVVLQIKSLAGDGLNPRHFGFIDPPPEDGLEAAIINLKQVGALTGSEALTPLGQLLSLLPVDPAVGKLLVLGTVLGLMDVALSLAAALSVQNPFSRLADDDDTARSARYELLSPAGDAITLLGVFEQWLRLKQQEGRSAASKKLNVRAHVRMLVQWCRRAGIEEQRLHEMAKLKAQFQELMTDIGMQRLVVRDEHDSLADEGHKRRRAHHMRSGDLQAAKARLRELHHQRDRERGRKVLKVDGGEEAPVEGEEQEDHEESSSEDEAVELRDLDLRVAVDLAAMAEIASRPITKHDTALIKWLLAASMYPRFAVPDEHNRQRREPECRFHTASLPDLVVHPGSSLTGNLTALSPQELLVYVELLETRRQYLCCNTPCWALAPLLLTANSIDTDTSCTRWIVDGWLLLRVHEEPPMGLKLLELVCGLRQQMALLLHRRLSQARLPGMTRNAPGTKTRVDTEGSAWQALPSHLLPQGCTSVQELVTSAAAAGVPSSLLAVLAYQPFSAKPGDDGVYKGASQHTAQSMLVPEGPAAAGQAPAAIAAHGKGGDGAGWLCVSSEDQVAAALALAMEWPCKYTLDRLLPGARTTAMYVLDDTSQDVPRDHHGAPRHKAGLRLTPWLQWGALRGWDSGLTAHALQPALRKHWKCPGCDTKLIGAYDDIKAHIDSCQQAQALPQEVLEASGYKEGRDTAAAQSADAGVKGHDADHEAPGQQHMVQQEDGVSATSAAGMRPDRIQTAAEELQSMDAVSSAVLRMDLYMQTEVQWGRRLVTSRPHHHAAPGRASSAERSYHDRTGQQHSGRKEQRHHDGWERHGSHHRHHHQDDAYNAARHGQQSASQQRSYGQQGHGHTHNQLEAYDEARGRWGEGEGEGEAQVLTDVHGVGQGYSDQMQSDPVSRHSHASTHNAGAWRDRYAVDMGAPQAHQEGAPGERVGGAAGPAGGRAKVYECGVCGLQAEMTPIQILQHKQTHRR